MKTISFLCLLLFASGLFAQDLNQKEFDKINSDIKRFLFSIEDSNHFTRVIEKFNLSQTDSIQIEKLIQNEKIEFLNRQQSGNNILPFYLFTDDPSNLELTVFCITSKPQRNGEEFQRGKYHFILKCEVGIEKKSPVYTNSSLILNQKSINNWFLKGYKTYLDKTGLVYDKFGYVPPPPPLPPTTLK